MEMISPQRVAEMLAVHGTHVTEEEAKIILEFMINLAKISLSQTLEYENRRPVHPRQHRRASR
jgi:hypothetical protein